MAIEKATDLSNELIFLVDFIWKESVGDFADLFDSKLIGQNNLFSLFSIEQVNIANMIAKIY